MVLRAKPLELDHHYTVEEFEELPEFNGRYELVDGKIVAKVAGAGHDRIARKIDRAIEKIDPDDTFGRTWRTATFKLGGDDGNGRMSDLAYIVADRVPPPSNLSITVVPDLVVEVWSPRDVKSRVDLNSTRKKMQYWPAHGVKIIWCVNPLAQEVEVLYADTSKPNLTLGFDQELSGEDVIPNLKIKISELFG